MSPTPFVPAYARIVSFTLALLVTAGTLGAIDHLAGQEESSPQWAAAVMAKRAA